MVTWNRNKDFDPSLAQELYNSYYTAEPFPHIAIDGFFDHDKLTLVHDDFPSPKNGDWWKYDNILEKKLARNDIHNLPHSLWTLIQELQSGYFVSFLEALTGIRGLITDHSLNGAGLHQIIQGGKLDIHADYNRHPITKLDRRVNVLVYLNKDWQPEWGGALELWNRDMSRCIKSILPAFNRMVIFNVTDWAYHGHPDPLTCPEHESRKSIAMYYYSNGRPSHEMSAPHSTRFMKRPQDPQDPEADLLRVQRAIRRLTE